MTTMAPRPARTAAVIAIAGALGAAGATTSSAEHAAAPKRVSASAAQNGGLPRDLAPSVRRAAQRSTNVRTVLRWYHVYETGNVDVYDRILAPGYRDIPLAGVPDGVAPFKKFVGGFGSVFNPLKVSVKEVVVGPRKVAVRSVITGRMVGPFLGLPANGKTFSWDALDTHTLSRGRIVVSHHLEDSLARAIGAGGKIVPDQG